jgi:hypothetical protein
MSYYEFEFWRYNRKVAPKGGITEERVKVKINERE